MATTAISAIMIDARELLTAGIVQCPRKLDEMVWTVNSAMCGIGNPLIYNIKDLGHGS